MASVFPLDSLGTIVSQWFFAPPTFRKRCQPVEGHDQQVHLSIVVEVAVGHTAGDELLLEELARSLRYVNEMAFAVVTSQDRLLGVQVMRPSVATKTSR